MLYIKRLSYTALFASIIFSLATTAMGSTCTRISGHNEYACSGYTKYQCSDPSDTFLSTNGTTGTCIMPLSAA